MHGAHLPTSRVFLVELKSVHVARRPALALLKVTTAGGQ
jgi:hypothetical protein